MMRNWIWGHGVLGAALCLGALTSPVRGDDGGITYGGAPRLLAGHPSVAMQSEVVRMEVGRKRVRVTCDFVFHNSGRACQVRMGFPDRGEGDSDPEHRGDNETPKEKPKGTFLTYASWVDGKPVPTKVVRGASSGQFWHAKTVSFKTGATRRVRDVYTLETGAQSLGDGLLFQTYYILHTGASWRGPIGRAEILVTFAPEAVPTPIRLTALRSLKERNPANFDRRRNTVVWDGPARPTVKGHTVRFVRSGWDPSEKDDVALYFGFLTQAEVNRWYEKQEKG